MFPNLEERPKIKVEYLFQDRLLDISTVGFIILCWALIITYFSDLPDQIPMHFNAAGQADRYGSKNEIFLLAGIATLIGVGLIALARFPRIFNYPVSITKENVVYQYHLGARFLRTVNATVTALFAWVVYSTVQASISESASISTWIVYGFILLIFVEIGVFMFIAIKRNPSKA